MTGPGVPPPPISGATRLAALIGDPARHSRSPAIHNAAFAARGLDWVFLAFEVAAGDAGAALAGMRGLGIDGLSVTMPHKTDVAHLVDELSDQARVLDAVNCVVRDGRRLIGHNTDGIGFLASLAEEAPAFSPVGARCVVLGAGGAARAVIASVADAGAAEVVVVNRTPAGSQAAVGLAGSAGRVGHPADLATDLAGADLVVQATSVGMDASSNPLSPEAIVAIGSGAVVADLIYLPRITPLLAAAAARGLTTVGGLGMLVHQAAAAFTLWTGQEAPLTAMAAAAEAGTGAPATGSGTAEAGSDATR
ncbi:MAG TPA: shikimate dehydrogenase [Acidimicrobiales bacterium]